MKINSDGLVDFSAAASASVIIRNSDAQAQNASRRTLHRMFNPPRGRASSSQTGQNLSGRNGFIPGASVVLLADSPSPVEFDCFGVTHQASDPMVQKTVSAAIEVQSEKVADSESSVRI